MSVDRQSATRIYSASRKYENLFETPLSASVLTSEEIKVAGCTSIPEALRLMPGVIVREMSNGNYDVHLRGKDNVSPNSTLAVSLNTSTLVMIDNRVVHNFLIGTTIWQALPIGINDLERIEVVRGSAAVLYGSNAASGVINLITKKEKKKGFFGTTEAVIGDPNSVIYHLSGGYRSDKLFAKVSLNTQRRERYENVLYQHFDNTYVLPDSLRDTFGRPLSNFGDIGDFGTSRSLETTRFSLFTEYQLDNKSYIRLNAGTEQTAALASYTDDNNTILSIATSESYYAQLIGGFGNFFFEADYNTGTLGEVNPFRTFDIFAEYNLKWIDKVSLKPILSYRNAFFEDNQGAISETLVNQDIQNFAVALNGNYTPNDKLRIMVGGRVDMFNNPEKNYWSYQFATTYLPQPNILFRIGASRAYQAPLFFQTYLDRTVSFPIAQDPITILNTNFIGDRNLDLIRTDLIELGLRWSFSSGWSVDLEVFRNQSSDYSELVQQETVFEPTLEAVFVENDFIVQNVDLTAVQYGITLASNLLVEKWQVRPFLTWQQTSLNDYSSYTNLPTVSPLLLTYDPEEFNIEDTEDVEHQGTPTFYGGLELSYEPISRLSLCATSFFWTDQVFFHRINVERRDGVSGVFDIDNKVLLNFTTRYKFTNKMNVFGTVKNILGDDAVEYARGARIGRSWWAGLTFSL